MKSYVALALASTALALPQTSGSSGCPSSAAGTFQIQTVMKPSSKRGLVERQLAGALTLTLENGILKDQAGRQGYIAANDQFQFDAPVQAGALETEGFALCSNNSLALTSGQRPFGATTFWQCLSGDFYNLYADSQGMQCQQIFIQAVNQGSGSASQISDGQPQATTPAASATNAVSQISDGQPQATTPAASVSMIVSQIPDGQPQATTPAASPPAVVSQISDGQPQAGTPAPSVPAVVSQISDGQPQAGTPAPAVSNVVSQISDGQPQAGTPAPSVSNIVSQISDGQPQAGTPAPSVSNIVSQISDGQPQAPVATANTTVPRPSASQPAEFTGAANLATFGSGAVAAGLFGLFALL